jgi:glycosyltransferase involved in cell wall biosynthesis
LDVLVVPSIWYENTPLVIYSAQAAGCPVIASNLGGIAEVKHHEDNGLLFKRARVEINFDN